ncbi:hypothetical protein CSC14_2861 [Proteus mirabilis]|nr:hypothetical protein CSC14_2861 [Proteus mirabilis]
MQTVLDSHQLIAGVFLLKKIMSDKQEIGEFIYKVFSELF